MTPSAKDFERAISCLREYQSTQRGIQGWILGSRPDDAAYGYKQCSPSEFLVRLGQAVYRAASYHRWMDFAHSLLRIMSLFRLEGD